MGAATVAWLLSNDGQTLAMLLVVAASMIATPLMFKAGAALADRFGAVQVGTSATVNADQDRHVVIVGYHEVGHLIDLMLERTNIPHIAVERDINVVQRSASAAGAISTSVKCTAPPPRRPLGSARSPWSSSPQDSDAAKTQALILHRV